MAAHLLVVPSEARRRSYCRCRRLLAVTANPCADTDGAHGHPCLCLITASPRRVAPRPWARPQLVRAAASRRNLVGVDRGEVGASLGPLARRRFLVAHQRRAE